MSDDFNGSRASRRNFLRGMGLVGGAAVASRLLTTGERVRAAGILGGDGSSLGGTLRVGALLPASTIYPTLASEFVAGMQLAFAPSTSSGLAARSVEVITQTIGRGHGTTYGQAQSLLAAKVDVVVGLLTPMMAARIASLFQAANTLLLASSTGENLPLAATQAVVFHHSLQQWQANWALGNWAAQSLGRRVVIASDFHDSGYDSLYGFQQGFSAAGGSVLEAVVTHGPQAAHDVNYLLKRIQNLHPDLVYAAYCGANAAELVQAYANLSGARPPLIGNGFLVDELLLPSMGKAAVGISSAHAWTPALDTPANRTFLATYQTSYGQTPSSLALLGYETGLLLNTALAASGGVAHPSRLAPALAVATIASPRGTVAMDANSHSTTGPLYLREVQWLDGVATNTVRHQIPAASQKGISAQGSGLKSGWLEAYLSI